MKTKYAHSLISLFLVAGLLITGGIPVMADGIVEPAVPAEAEVPSVSGKGVLLMEAQSGAVLYALNRDEPLPMASTTKIMTALIALEHCDTDQIMTVPKEAVGVEGSSAYLMEGEKMTLGSLLYALMLQSANDAAVAVAIGVGGSVDQFVTMMNEKAHSLGMSHSHFANPNGLPNENHYASALDMATLTAAALRNDTFRQIVSTYKKTVTSENEDAVRVFVNHNRLLRTYDGMIGVKTGYTKIGGRCLVSAAERDGVTLICVTLNDPNDWKDHTSLLDWGFPRCENVSLLREGALSLMVDVVGNRSVNQISVTNKSDISCIRIVGSGEVSQMVEVPDFVYAPLKAGETIGYVRYLRDGKVIGESELTVKENVTSDRKERGIGAFFKRLFHIKTK